MPQVETARSRPTANVLLSPISPITVDSRTAYSSVWVGGHALAPLQGRNSRESALNTAHAQHKLRPSPTHSSYQIQTLTAKSKLTSHCHHHHHLFRSKTDSLTMCTIQLNTKWTKIHALELVMVSPTPTLSKHHSLSTITTINGFWLTTNASYSGLLGLGLGLEAKFSGLGLRLLALALCFWPWPRSKPRPRSKWPIFFQTQCEYLMW